MIKKILIANRGEITLRVIKTCRRLGIESVSIYAQDDASLPQCFESDESVNLGSGSLAQTYLNQDKIIQIAKSLGCDAIHPGYGFLSENTDFCQKVELANLIFIGPSASSIELMGDKKASKVKMEEEGIPVVPGYHGDDQNGDTLLLKAKKVGFPLLIKATAGGGGKGMRIVQSAHEFLETLKGAKREALNAFGNDNVLLEKYIVNPRHIEVQLVSDGKGNHFHFFERECSIQRRYQKVIEETPACALSEELREEMCLTALKIATSISYRGAGTIEFILADNKSFYFLEMNTRLQVEHPVTEMVTGFDLVELQILAASGEAFKFQQSDITQKGHSIECRIYAEDPDNNFLPTGGRIQKIRSDISVDYRLDCGYQDGNTISMSYDPMLAKLIVFDEDRYVAIEKMQLALNDVLFAGAKTNRDFLKRILDNERFLSGEIHTHFLEEEKENLARKSFDHKQRSCFIAGVLLLETGEAQNIWERSFKKLKKKLLFNNVEYEIEIIQLSQRGVHFSWEGHEYLFTCISWEEDSVLLECEGEMLKVNAYTFTSKGDKQVFVNGNEGFVQIFPKARGRFSGVTLTQGSLQSPMPGKIFKILCATGNQVKKGEPVLIVEAMKMEHTICSPRDGQVKEFFFKEGDQIQGGVLLCEIE